MWEDDSHDNVVCVCVQVSSVLRAEDSLCDLAAVPLHQRSQSYLQEVSAPPPVLQREGKMIHVFVAENITVTPRCA